MRNPVRRAAFPWVAAPWPTGIDRPPPESRLGVDYDAAWAQRDPVRLARAMVLDGLARPTLAWLARPTTSGLDRIGDLQGPVIVAANHASHIDTALVLTALPAHLRHRTLVAGAADYFFDRAWKAAFWAGAVGAFPVERLRISRRSTDLAADLLDQGWNLVIFPEGGRSPDGWAQPFRAGAAYLARRSGAPVVPVHLAGTSAVHGKGRPGVHRARTRVTFGPVLRPGDDEDARRFSARIEAAVAALADESATDWWSARRRAASGTTPPLTGPEASSWRRAWALGPTRPRSARSAPPWPLRPSPRGRS